MLRRLNLLLMLLFGSLWAGLLVVGGAMLATRGATTWPGMRLFVLSAGITGVIAGFFVFSVVVADRLFPRAERRLVATMETTAGLALLIGVASTITIFIAGSPQ